MLTPEEINSLVPGSVPIPEEDEDEDLDQYINEVAAEPELEPEPEPEPEGYVDAAPVPPSKPAQGVSVGAKEPDEISKQIYAAGVPLPNDPAKGAAVIDRSKLPQNPLSPHDVPTTARVPPLPASATARPPPTPVAAPRPPEPPPAPAPEPPPTPVVAPQPPEPPPPRPDTPDIPAAEALDEYYDPHAVTQRSGEGDVPEVGEEPPEKYIEPPKEEGDPHNKYMTQGPAPQASGQWREWTPAKIADTKEEEKKEDSPAVAVSAPTEDEETPREKQWFENLGPPPTRSGIPGAIGGLGLGILGALLARKDPAVAASMLGLGGLSAIGELTSNPNQDYWNKLRAGKEQSAILKNSERADPNSLGARRLALAERKQRILEAKDEVKRIENEKLADMDSAETLRERKIARDLSIAPDGSVLAGGLSDQQLNSMSGLDIRRWRTGLQQQAANARAAGHSLDMFNARLDARARQDEKDNAEYDRRHDMQIEATKDKEQREIERDLQRTQIGGYKYIGPVAPDSPTFGKAIDMSGAIGRAVGAARRLKELSSKVRWTTQAGKLAYHALGSDAEQKAIMAEMEANQQMLAAAQRFIFHQGVPQQFEMAINAKSNPDADSLAAIIKGQTSWEALEKVMRAEGARQMRLFNYFADEDLGDPTQIPATGVVAPPAAAAPAVDPAAMVKAMVRIKDKWVPKDMSRGAFDKMKQQLQDKILLVQ